MSWRKCRYQLDDCENWTDDDLTLGLSQWLVGLPGRATLVSDEMPICKACLDANPEPLNDDG